MMQRIKVMFKLFRNITQIYCAEKLIRGEGHFPNLFESLQLESAEIKAQTNITRR